MTHFEMMIDAQGVPSYLIDGGTVDLATFQAAQASDPVEIAIRERAERLAMLEAPIVPLPIEGSTVEDIKDSATAAIADLVEQMTARLALLGGSNA